MTSLNPESKNPQHAKNQTRIFSRFEKLGQKEFGGSYLRGNPRDQRPIAIKRPMHLVMRSSLATGDKSFLRVIRARKIQDLVFRIGKLKDVRVYRYANSGNHLHIVVLARSRVALIAYLRAISGLIARITLGVERGRALGKKFWDARPYTRIVEWGRDFKTILRYLEQNILEALGFIPYQPRKHKNRLRSADS